MTNLLSLNEEQALQMVLNLTPNLNPGVKAHINELFNNNDPTGGLISIEDQVEALYRQYVATWNRI